MSAWNISAGLIIIPESKAEGTAANARRREQCQKQTHVSARTIRVLLAFSILNLTLPPSPAIRPIALDK